MALELPDLDRINKIVEDRINIFNALSKAQRTEVREEINNIVLNEIQKADLSSAQRNTCYHIFAKLFTAAAAFFVTVLATGALVVIHQTSETAATKVARDAVMQLSVDPRFINNVSEEVTKVTIDMVKCTSKSFQFGDADSKIPNFQTGDIYIEFSSEECGSKTLSSDFSYVPIIMGGILYGGYDSFYYDDKLHKPNIHFSRPKKQWENKPDDPPMSVTYLGFRLIKSSGSQPSNLSVGEKQWYFNAAIIWGIGICCVILAGSVARLLYLLRLSRKTADDPRSSKPN